MLLVEKVESEMRGKSSVSQMRERIVNHMKNEDFTKPFFNPC